MPPDPQLNNWQRWGATDEIGTANLITPGAIVHAARLVRRVTIAGLSTPAGSRPSI
jgi:hypothetical protein